MRSRAVIIVVFGLLLALTACGPTEEEIQVTAVELAANIFSTQTALAPPTVTLTATRTPWATATETPIFTPTFTPENTPTPTQTLVAEEVPNLLICYQAAVSLYADWEVYDEIASGVTDWDALNRFMNERKFRANAVTSSEQFQDIATALYEAIMGIDNSWLKFKGYDLLEMTACEPYARDMLQVDWFIKNNYPSGVGAPERLSQYRGDMRKIVTTIRQALLDVYDLSEDEVNALEDPFWQNVVTRYQIEIPAYR